MTSGGDIRIIPKNARRMKFGSIISLVVGAAAVMLAWTQPWFALTLDGGQVLGVPGQSAAPALAALVVATLALAGALSIARGALRTVLGGVEAAIGGTVTLLAASTVSDPVAASENTVTDATAVSGTASIAALVLVVALTAWPWVALVAGGALALIGLTIVVTSRRWPGPAQRFETSAGDGDDPTGVWNSLSDGDDPTARKP